jgi:replication factor C subunit 3/5
MDILWTSKYCPTAFNDLQSNAQLNDKLVQLSKTVNLPHLILYGPDGAGKRCRINCLLAKIYGRSALRTTKETYTTKNNSTNVEVSNSFSK